MGEKRGFNSTAEDPDTLLDGQSSSRRKSVYVKRGHNGWHPMVYDQGHRKGSAIRPTEDLHRDAPQGKDYRRRHWRVRVLQVYRGGGLGIMSRFYRAVLVVHARSKPGSSRC